MIYGLHNRLNYNRMCLPVILHEAKTSPDVTDLIIIDDESTDGSSEWIAGMRIAKYLGDSCQFSYMRLKVGNSTSQYQLALDELERKDRQCDYLTNYCNDCIIPEGIVSRMVEHMKEFPNLFAVGAKVDGGKMYKGNGIATSHPYIADKNLIDSSHIGIGMYRVSVFNTLGAIVKPHQQSEKRFFGFTQYQNTARSRGYEIKIDLGIRIVELDRNSQHSQLIEHVRKGWTRNIIGNPPSVFNLTNTF